MRRAFLSACVSLAFLGMSPLSAVAQVVPTLFPFNGSNGSNPNSLIQAQDGFFYGTTAAGGSTLGNKICVDAGGKDVGCGTVFRLNADHTITTIKNFQGGKHGASPTGLIQGGDGNFYGTAAFGGSSVTSANCGVDTQGNNIGCGVIFEIAASPLTGLGSYSIVYNFQGAADGAYPNPLIMGSGTALYGSTLSCGSNDTACTIYGVLFSYATGQTGSSSLTVLYTFTVDTDQELAYPNALLQGSDGNLYGTTQLGGNSDCLDGFGCGGIFQYDLTTGALTGLCFAESCDGTDDRPAITSRYVHSDPQNSRSHRAGSTGVLARPAIVARQPGGRFPTDNAAWSFMSAPIFLTQGSDGNIYGTTPPAYIDDASGVSYSTSGSAADDAIASNASTIFQYVPAANTQTSTATLNTIYAFSGNGDGGGTTVGLTLASDGNFYGSSGGDEFQLTGNEIGEPSSWPLSSLDPTGNYFATFSTGTPTSQIQDSKGDFYGTTTDGAFGSVFRVVPSSASAGPVTLTFSSSQVTSGTPVTLKWSVSNAFSTTAQQCYGSNSLSGVTTLWSGSLVDGVYSGSLTFTPQFVGTANYALTCGGTESGFATLTVTPAPLTIITTSLTNGLVDAFYTATLSASGGTRPYNWSVISGGLPPGLNLNASTGVISGTPSQRGTFSVGLQVSDSEASPAMATATFSLTIAPLPLTISLPSLPNATVNIPYAANLTAAGGVPPYSWALVSGTAPAWLSLQATGAISGTPTQAGPATFTVQVSDSDSPSATATAQLSLSVLAATGLQFVPVTPCRIADTRNPAGPFGAPAIGGGQTRTFPIPQSACGIPSTAAAYSLNVTVVPGGELGYLTVWPAGQPLPTVSLLNSIDGRVKANAAIVPAGASGAISIYANAQVPTQVVIDISGYFIPATASSLEFYPLAPCRVVDTRNAAGPLSGPSLAAGQARSFPLQSSSCMIPPSAQAYSLNVTVVPSGPLGYLTMWPAGEVQPTVSTLNAPTGTVTANAAIVPAGNGGAVSVFVTNDSQLILDVNGYFAPPNTGGNSLYTTVPCRILDTREHASTPFPGTYEVNVQSSGCALSAGATAMVLNATVVPVPRLGYLSLWPAGASQPVVSTLNAVDGAITSNMAIVPATNGAIDAYATNATQLILDLSSYFAP
jgi:Putative Ig domain